MRSFYPQQHNSMRLFSFIFILIFRQHYFLMSLFSSIEDVVLESHDINLIEFMLSLASFFYFLHFAFFLLLSLSILFLSFIDFLDSFFIDRIALTTSFPQRFSLSFVQLHPIKTDSETFELNTFKFTDR